MGGESRGETEMFEFGHELIAKLTTLLNFANCYVGERCTRQLRTAQMSPYETLVSEHVFVPDASPVAALTLR